MLKKLKQYKYFCKKSNCFTLFLAKLLTNPTQLPRWDKNKIRNKRKKHYTPCLFAGYKTEICVVSGLRQTTEDCLVRGIFACDCDSLSTPVTESVMYAGQFFCEALSCHRFRMSSAELTEPVFGAPGLRL